MDSLPFVMTRDFAVAARTFRQDMARLVLRHDFVAAVPEYRPDDWYDGDGNNCTSFMLNRNLGAVDPGMTGCVAPDPVQLAADPRSAYLRGLHRDCLRDGLVYLGDRFADCAAGSFPAALFVAHERDGDYHWMALRRIASTPVWAHKPGGLDSERCDHSGQTIFNVADEVEYPVFCGYYAVPIKLGHEKPPQPVRAGGSRLF
jgi:hypothetical protein